MPLEISEALVNSLRQFEPYFAAQAALVGPEFNASLAKVGLVFFYQESLPRQFRLSLF